MDIIISGMMGAILTTTFVEIPIIIVRDYITSLGWMSLFTPLIIGTMGASGYMIKRNKDYMKAFNNLNNELGENSLPNKINEAYEEQQYIDFQIENKIREISIVESHLQERKRIIESFPNDSVEKKQTIDSTISKDHKIEEPKKDTNQERIMPFINDEEYGIALEKTKGPSLVLRRKPNNTQNSQK